MARDLLFKALEKNHNVATLITTNPDVAGSFLAMFDLLRTVAQERGTPIEKVQVSWLRPANPETEPKAKPGELCARVQFPRSKVRP